MCYRIALVEYLNTLPFTQGIRMNGLDKHYDLHFGPPGYCAHLYQQGQVDIALCPIGALTDLPEYKIFSEYCIGANNAVRTVVLNSKFPLDQIKRVRLDDHSRTSNLLMQVLAKNLWKKDWEIYRDDEDVPDSAVMIGDKVFQFEDQYPYSIDLAESWNALTDLPMVFAVWIARPEVPNEKLRELEEAFSNGMEWIKEDKTGLTSDKQHYLLHSINFQFDEAKKEALLQFSKYVTELKNQTKNLTQS